MSAKDWTRFPEGLYICHKCDVPLCVNPGHLYAGTQRENIADAVRRHRHSAHGHGVGEANPCAKIDAETVIAIRHMCSNRVTQRECAERFGISQGTVSAVVRGKRWSHVGGQ